jgi:hypothetical protein
VDGDRGVHVHTVMSGVCFIDVKKKEIYLQTSKPVYASLNKMITSLFVGDMKTGCLIYIWD